VGFNAVFASNSTGDREVFIRLNKTGVPSGSDYIVYHTANATSGNRTSIPISTVTLLKAKDYVEVSVQQDSGGNLDIENGYNGNTFGVFKIADTPVLS